jgi:hypothetical protein
VSRACCRPSCGPAMLLMILLSEEERDVVPPWLQWIGLQGHCSISRWNEGLSNARFNKGSTREVTGQQGNAGMKMNDVQSRGNNVHFQHQWWPK